MKLGLDPNAHAYNDVEKAHIIMKSHVKNGSSQIVGCHLKQKGAYYV